jgi:hypothetical protein
MTLSVGLPHTQSPAHLIKSVDMVVDGPVCAKAFLEYLVDNWPRSSLAS